MKKFKKKFLLTGLALAVPLVGAIASTCSEVGQDSPTPPPGGSGGSSGGSSTGSGGSAGGSSTGSGGSSGGSSTGSGGSTMMKNNNENILEHLPDFL